MNTNIKRHFTRFLGIHIPVGEKGMWYRMEKGILQQCAQLYTWLTVCWRRRERVRVRSQRESSIWVTPLWSGIWEREKDPVGCALLCRKHAQLLSHVQLFATPGTAAHVAPLSWNFPGKNTGVGCHFLLQGIFPTQGLNLRLLNWQVDSLPLSHVGSPV